MKIIERIGWAALGALCLTVAFALGGIGLDLAHAMRDIWPKWVVWALVPTWSLTILALLVFGIGCIVTSLRNWRF